MASGKNQHITPHKGGGWQIVGAGNEKATKITPTKQEAINGGRRIAQNQHAELIIHGKNGRIQEKYSYGHDPFPPRG